MFPPKAPVGGAAPGASMQMPPPQAAQMPQQDQGTGDDPAITAALTQRIASVSPQDLETIKNNPQVMDVLTRLLPELTDAIASAGTSGAPPAPADDAGDSNGGYSLPQPSTKLGQM